MPKIQITEQLLYNAMKETPTFEQLEQMLVSAKAEIDEPADEEGTLKIELNDTNRPDLWSTMGLSRQLNAYKGDNTLSSSYTFFNDNPDADKKVIVDSNIQAIRPYVCGFIVSGKHIDEHILAELIQTQEKLCHNYGQKRQAIAIGIYREDLIQWPVHYRGADPDRESFMPLEFSKELTLRNILKEHPKGQEYGHIIETQEKFPLLIDSNNNVLSMPPIINSEHIGAVQIGDSSLFIECTGTNLEQLMLVVNLLACDCKDLGFDVTRVQIEYPTAIESTASTLATQKKEHGHVVVAPTRFQSNVIATVEEINTLLGVSLSTEEIQQALLKMNVETHCVDNATIEVIVPVYRNDFLHSVDIIEDILVGKGLDFFTPNYPKSFTIGRLTDIEYTSRKVINTMVGLGFQEMMFPYLGSKVDFIENMYEQAEWDTVQSQMIQVSNPISENYEFVRASIFPNLLETERVSANSMYPHKICEIGKVVVKDAQDVSGTRTDTALGFLIADTTIGFTDINSIVTALCYYSDIQYTQRTIVDSRFISGRVAEIVNEETNMPIGIFGEAHPRVLHSYGITMPCVMGELIINKI